MPSPIQDYLKFSGLTAVVTGASSGIGKATAESFARQGANVVLVARDNDRLSAVVEGLVTDRAEGQRHLKVVGDIASPETPSDVIEQTKKAFGAVDIVVNNAAFLHRQADATTATPKDTWDQVMDTNVRSYYLMAKAALPHLGEKKGAIVNVSSIWAMIGAKKQVAYSVSKAAIVELTRSLALDFADFGVRVNCVCPSTTRTPLLMRGRDSFDEAAVAKMHPLGRIGEPEDVANAVMFLASNASSWITGAALPVDGGYTIQ